MLFFERQNSHLKKIRENWLQLLKSNPLIFVIIFPAEKGPPPSHLPVVPIGGDLFLLPDVRGPLGAPRSRTRLVWFLSVGASSLPSAPPPPSPEVASGMEQMLEGFSEQSLQRRRPCGRVWGLTKQTFRLTGATTVLVCAQPPHVPGARGSCRQGILMRSIPRRG